MKGARVSTFAGVVGMDNMFHITGPGNQRGIFHLPLDVQAAPGERICVTISVSPPELEPAARPPSVADPRGAAQREELLRIRQMLSSGMTHAEVAAKLRAEK